MKTQHRKLGINKMMISVCLLDLEIYMPNE